MRRLLLLLIVVLGLAPGTWLRTAYRGERTDDRQILNLAALATPRQAAPGFEVAGAWQLTSPNWHFRGYSALVALEDGELLALNDGGRMLRFFPPGAERRGVKFDFFASLRGAEKRFADGEGLTRDPASGNLWASYENTNLIERYGADLRPSGLVRPPAMQRWPSNGGPEALLRLSDGRFIVLSENNPSWLEAGLPGLLFPGDPVEGAEPELFGFMPPDRFRPVDMTQLPDGRVLILLREVIWEVPPRFEAMLMLADPAAIEPGKTWRGEVLARLAEPVPMDNYEGIAVEPQQDGRLALWLISDDNHATFQRTLLLKLLWDPNEKARGNRSRAPY